MDERIYQIALTQLTGIGPVLAKKLLTHCGTASAVFLEKPDLLRKISRIGANKLSQLSDKSILKRAEEELRFTERHKLQVLFIDDAHYPERLRHCHDAPLLLYHCGNTNLNAKRIVSIVGTRSPSEYGKELCMQFVKDLAQYNVLIVSGLAYGIDAIAHKMALEQNIPTLGVLAHGLDQIYPYAHRGLARQMTESGGLLTDFPSQTKPDRENFPMRNRIVAGLSDAVIVVESGVTGGSLITTEFANNYNRDVFAFPGRANDEKSAGCLRLIKGHKAALITSAADVALGMNWESGVQTTLAVEVKPEIEKLEVEEATVVGLLNGRGEVHISDLTTGVNLCHEHLLDIMASLELNGWVKSIPGNYYRLKRSCVA
ncbi:MAG: DNA-processing protein DprA [Bacteroidia bacterium]|jgi:DNA processing protein|nr:DNA-processing protein DprA [Bacteroidia bacterium]